MESMEAHFCQEKKTIVEMLQMTNVIIIIILLLTSEIVTRV